MQPAEPAQTAGEHRAEAESELENDEPTIDLPALADHVYDLLRRELRLEQERLGRARFL